MCTFNTIKHNYFLQGATDVCVCLQAESRWRCWAYLVFIRHIPVNFVTVVQLKSCLIMEISNWKTMEEEDFLGKQKITVQLVWHDLLHQLLLFCKKKKKKKKERKMYQCYLLSWILKRTDHTPQEVQLELQCRVKIKYFKSKINQKKLV